MHGDGIEVRKRQTEKGTHEHSPINDGGDQDDRQKSMNEKESSSSLQTGTNEANKNVVDEVLTSGCESNRNIQPGSHWLTRVVFLRSIGLIYTVAFLVAFHQNRALVGSNGLLPADMYMRNILEHSENNIWVASSHAPTLLWLVDWQKNIDEWLDYMAIAGILVSSFVMVTGSANMIMMFILWILYHSIANVGQRWYSFGWESQLLETGFLAIFFVPVLKIQSLPILTPPSLVVIWGYRWLIFRIMLGAGLIKIRGDECWRDLTCMNYHYETQPVPNPVSWWMHQEPEAVHKLEVLGNHFVELVAPFFMILGRVMCMVNGFLQILFQVVLIISGNLSFLNWLTILPSICCFDDRFLCRFSSSATRKRISELQIKSKYQLRTKGQYIRTVMNISLACLLAYLSIPVVQNLLSSHQAMNTSFEPLRIVNTYGAFGSITKRRTEIIIQGTSSDSPNDPRAIWLEYEFKCKPGNVSVRPCVISPYHYRLDWLMWFAAFQNYQHNPWLVHLVAKLLVNDELTTELIAYNPFRGGDPPRWIRAEHYRYSYSKWNSAQAKSGDWYVRKRKGAYLPPQNLEYLRPILARMGWKDVSRRATRGKE